MIQRELRSQHYEESWHCFQYPKNPYLNRATHTKKKNTCQILLPKKIPESKISNQKKSFDHPHHLKFGVAPLGSHRPWESSRLAVRSDYSRLWDCSNYGRRLDRFSGEIIYDLKTGGQSFQLVENSLREGISYFLPEGRPGCQGNFPSDPGVTHQKYSANWSQTITRRNTGFK